MTSTPTNNTDMPSTLANMSDDHHEGVETVPWPRKSLIIQQYNTRSILTMVASELKLVKCSEMYHGRFRWNCKEKGGHLIFQNSPNGASIGYDTHSEQFVATSGSHSQAQYLVPRKHPDGSYVLLINLQGEMVGMMVTDRGILTTPREDEWTRWNFHDISWIY